MVTVREMAVQRWAMWTPRPRDIGQADEVTWARMLYVQLTENLPEDERCLRSFRATEVERVVAELRRAALAVTADEPDERLASMIVRTRYVEPIAALNLMGIETMLPGEPPFDVATVLPTGTHLHLRTAASPASAVDVLDAVSGLIGDFHRLTVFLNGLRIEQTRHDHDVQSTVVALHPGLMIAFGEFLTRKYVVEGWRLG
jgi:hypothetical protein